MKRHRRVTSLSLALIVVSFLSFQGGGLAFADEGNALTSSRTLSQDDAESALALIQAVPDDLRRDLIEGLAPEMRLAIDRYLGVYTIEVVGVPIAFSCPPNCNIPPPPDGCEPNCPNPQAGGAGAVGNSGANLAPGCYRFNPYVRVYAKNFWGATLWTYGNDIQWCQNGTIITYVANTPKVSISSPFWQFNSHITNQIQGGPGTVGFTSFVQGSLSACMVGNWGCYYNATPWVEIQGSGLGAWTYSGGG